MRARHALWLIPLLALVVPAAASAADPEDVLLGWSWGQVSLVSDASGEIECTVSDALLHLAEPGEPDLPAHLVRVPIPDGTKVASWELAGASTSERPAQGILATALQDAPTPDGGPRQVALRDDAYASGSYPASRVRYLSTSMRRGQVFAHFAVYPVVAIEEGAQLSLLESGRLIVHLEGDATAPRPLKVLRSGAEDLWRRDFQGEGRSQALREAVSDLPALSSAPVEYLIITTEALAPSVQLLADWKNQSGTPTVIRTVEWIRENYPNGVDDQERIRHFLQAAYQYWGVQYVLIAGGPAQVPMRLAKSYSWNVPAGVDIITDLYYACLDGNWNADGDAVFGEPVRGSNPPNPIGDDVDFDAELYVGRIPASDATQLLQFLQKYVNTYIKSPNTQGYLDRVLFLGEVLFDAEWKRSLLPRCGACGSGCDTCVSLDGAGDAVRTIGIIDQAIDEGRVPPLEKVELYEWYEYWRQNGRPNAQPETKSSVIDKINEGMGLIHHVGHGDRDRMSIGTIDGFDGAGRLLTSDARAVTNGDKIGVLYSINCNSAAIDYDCVAEALLFAENGGVICYIGSTNLDFPAAATGFMESTYTKIFHDKAPYLGDAYYHTIAEQMAGNTGFDSYRRFLSYSLILLGDPQIHMWLGTPKPLEVSAQQTSYTLGESSLTINVRRNGQGVPDVQVCAYKPNDTYAIATTNANGQAVVPFQATSTGNFIVTATGFTSIPGTFSRNVEKPSGEAVAATALAIDDSPGGQTAGNGDGVFDQGETVGLRVSLANGGNGASGPLTLSLGLEPPSVAGYFEVQDASEDVGSVAANTTDQVTAFRIRSSSPVPKSFLENGDRVPLVARITITPQAGQARTYRLALPVLRPVFRVEGSVRSEVSGDGDGIPENGERISWRPVLRDLGSGSVGDLRAILTPVQGGTIVAGYDTSSVDDGEAGDLVTANPPFQFEVQNAAILKMKLEVRSKRDDAFVFLSKTVDFVSPSAPSFPDTAQPKATKDAIVLTWTKSSGGDVDGYALERSQDQVHFERAQPGLVRGMEYYRDGGLAGLSRYYYRVAAVDSSGNQSAFSNVVAATTSPGMLSGWPFTIVEPQLGCPTVENLIREGERNPFEVVIAGQTVYAMKADGLEVMDGDHVVSTPGIWAPGVPAYWNKPAVADIDRDGNMEIVAVSRYDDSGHGTAQIRVWRNDGTLLWSKAAGYSNYMLSSPVIANIDSDPQFEIVLNSRGCIFAWNHDGTPVKSSNSDGKLVYLGSGNPSDPGTWPGPNDWPLTYGTPAVADLDGDDREEIVLGLERNMTGSPSAIYVIDGDGSVLASQQLESGLVGDFKAQNSSVSIADVDNDLQYDIYLATRNYLWGFGYEPGSKQLIAKFPKRPIDQLPTRWPETTPALGDIDGDGDLDVALGVGQGRVTAIDATEGTVLPGFPVRVAPVTSTKIGSPILMNLDSDLAAEIVVGDNGGVVYALDGDGTMMIGFPYFTGGRIQHGLAAWDVDRDGHPNLLIQAEQQPAVTILDIDNVNFPADLAAAMAANPWPSFRHDARNTGRQDAAVITPVRTLAAEASGEAGAALLIWSTQEPVEVFRIERRDAMGGWELRASGVASDFGSDGSYSYRDPAAPGRQSYRIVGLDGFDREILVSPTIDVNVRALELRLIGAIPNPFNPRTAIRFESPGASSLRLEIIDLQGRRVRILRQGSFAGGAAEEVWDGRDDQGRDVGSGVYLIRLQGGSASRTEKLVLLR